MTNFGQDWNKQSNSGISEKFQGLVKKEQPLKPRIENTIKGLNSPISKLNKTSNQLSEKEQKIFDRIVQAKQNGDIRTAKALANELAQMRKTSSMMEI